MTSQPVSMEITIISGTVIIQLSGRELIVQICLLWSKKEWYKPIRLFFVKVYVVGKRH